MTDLKKDMKVVNKVIKLYSKVVFQSIVTLIFITAWLIICTFSDKGAFSSGFTVGFISMMPFFFSMASINAIINKFSGNNFSLLLTLPIKIENVTAMVYRLVDLATLISFGGSCILALAFGNIRAVLMLLLLTAPSLIGAYLFVNSIANSQLELSLSQGQNYMKIMGFSMIIFMILGIFSAVIAGVLRVIKLTPLTIILCVILFFSLSLAAYYVRKSTYKKAYIKIRGMALKKS